jgi:hypothetical protein
VPLGEKRKAPECISEAMDLGQPISRVLSGTAGSLQAKPPPACSACAIIHLGPCVAAGLKRPTRSSKEASDPPPMLGLRSCLALLPMGVAWPPTLLPTPVVSYTTFSPLPDCSGGHFLWPYPRVASPGCFPASCYSERGLSSNGMRRPRSPGRPIHLLYHTSRHAARQLRRGR